MKKNDNEDSAAKINPNKLLNKFLCCSSSARKPDKKSKKLLYDYSSEKKYNVTRNMDSEVKTVNMNFEVKKEENDTFSNLAKQKTLLSNEKLTEGLLPVMSPEMGKISYREKTEEIITWKEPDSDSINEHPSLKAAMPELKCKSKNDYFKYFRHNTEAGEREGDYNEDSYFNVNNKTFGDVSETCFQMQKTKHTNDLIESEMFKIKNRDTGEIFDLRSEHDALKKINSELSVPDFKKVNRLPWGAERLNNIKENGNEIISFSFKENIDFPKNLLVLQILHTYTLTYFLHI